MLTSAGPGSTPGTGPGGPRLAAAACRWGKGQDPDSHARFAGLIGTAETDVCSMQLPPPVQRNSAYRSHPALPAPSSLAGCSSPPACAAPALHRAQPATTAPASVSTTDLDSGGLGQQGSGLLGRLETDCQGGQLGLWRRGEIAAGGDRQGAAHTCACWAIDAQSSVHCTSPTPHVEMHHTRGTHQDQRALPALLGTLRWHDSPG